MPKMIRASETLRSLGIKLEVHRCAWGYALHDPDLQAQRTPVHDTPDDAVRAAIDGERPEPYSADEDPHPSAS